MTSKKYSFTLLVFTLSILLQNCKYKLDYLTGKTISIPCNQEDFDEFAAGMGFASFDSLFLMNRFNINNNTLEIQNLISQETAVFMIPEMVREMLTNKADYRLISPDTVPFYSWISQNLLFWDLKNNTLDNINFIPVISSLDSTLVPVSSPIFPFQIKDNIMVFTNSYTNLVLNKKSNIQEYFNKKSLTCIDLSHSDYSSHIFGEFPGSYRAGNLYSDPYAKSCLNNKQQVICSYSSSDTISVYSINGEQLHNTTTKSKYAMPFQPIDLEKNLDSKYNMEYALTNISQSHAKNKGEGQFSLMLVKF